MSRLQSRALLWVGATCKPRRKSVRDTGSAIAGLRSASGRAVSEEAHGLPEASPSTPFPRREPDLGRRAEMGCNGDALGWADTRREAKITRLQLDAGGRWEPSLFRAFRTLQPAKNTTRGSAKSATPPGGGRELQSKSPLLLHRQGCPRRANQPSSDIAEIPLFFFFPLQRHPKRAYRARDWRDQRKRPPRRVDQRPSTECATSFH